eukprot:1159177-Pelagomonas_calceolata.AAC.14
MAAGPGLLTPAEALKVSDTHTYTHARKHTHTRTYIHTRKHTHTYTHANTHRSIKGQCQRFKHSCGLPHHSKPGPGSVRSKLICTPTADILLSSCIPVWYDA